MMLLIDLISEYLKPYNVTFRSELYPNLLWGIFI